MRAAALLVALTMSLGGCASSPSGLPLTVGAHDDLPALWRPSPALRRVLDDTPWTAAETERAERAALAGVIEMGRYLDGRPEVVAELGVNAVECFLNATYAASEHPSLKSRALAEATRRLRTVLAPWMKRAPGSVQVDEWGDVVTMAVYARHLFGAEHPSTLHLVRLANAAAGLATSLSQALGVTWREILRADPVPNEQAYELLLWCVVLIDARAVPGLVFPPGTDEFGRRVWPMLRDYPLIPARRYADRGNDYTFYDTAYLATHIGYVPTGYGRHALAIADSPGLYVFLRENFYDVLEMGELDLVAEFVDLLRQYGATEDNDLQVRHGTRHLLRLYAKAGSWMAHRESYETAESNPYDLIHKPWTAIAGVRRRRPEPAGPGTYAESFAAWCRSEQ